MAARGAGKVTLNAYEAEREERIRRNNAKLGKFFWSAAVQIDAQTIEYCDEQTVRVSTQ